MNTNLQNVKLTDIKISPRFRKDYGDIKELVVSVKEKGILQPISLNKNLELAAGGRRYMAAAAAGLSEIPCLIRDTDDLLDRLEVELFENIHRKQMEWHEEVELTNAITNLYKDKYGKRKWGQRNTAELLNKSLGGVNESLKLAESIKAIPELKNCKTKKDAMKLLQKVDKHIEIKEARKEQKERIRKGGLSAVARAESNFEIGDAFTGMAELIAFYMRNKTTSTIRLIEVDPPYAIDLNEVKKKGNITPEDLKIYEEVSKENYPQFLIKTTKLLYALASPDSWTIFWFGPTWFTEVKFALTEAGFQVDDIPGIWVKGDEDSEGTGQTNQPNLYLARAYEPFFIARKGNPRLNKPGRSNIFNYKPVPPKQKYHPTQRPIELIEELITTFAIPGTNIMVPFLGSGTTLRAAYRQDCTSFGWELNKHNKDPFLLSIENDHTLKKKEEEKET